MGMDGLSMANTGALKEPTSADYASRMEQDIQSDSTNNTKQVQTLSTNRRVQEKSEQDLPQRQQNKQKDKPNNNEFQDGLREEPVISSQDFDIDELDDPNKDFYVKLNSKDDIIELYDSSTERLVETITGDELGELVKKLNMASGIFINKKV